MPRIVKKELPELPVVGKTMPELAKLLKKSIIAAKKYEALMDQHKKLVHKLSVEVLPPMMEAENTDDKNIVGVGRLEYGIEVYPNIKKDDIPAWFAWLRKEKHGAIITESVHPKTQQAFVKEQLIAGVKLPLFVNVAKIPTVALKAEKK